MVLSRVLIDAHVAAGRGRHTAIVDAAGRISYEELQGLVRRIASGLRRRGVAPGDRVLLALPSDGRFIAAWLAVQYLGGIAVSVAPVPRRREIAAIVADVEPRLAVTAGALPIEALPSVTIGALDRGAGGDAPPHDGDPDAIAVIAHGIGVDGRPYGACHSASAMLASAEGYARGVLGLSAADVVGGHPPLALAYGLGALLVCPLYVGATTVPAPAFDAEALLGSIARERVSVFFGTATCYRLLLQAPALMRRFDLRSLRLCVSAGEPLEARVSEAWTSATGVDLLDGLGTTELFHIVVSQQPGRVMHGALGRPVPGYELRVADEKMRAVADGSEGLLAVRGPTGARYWRRPDLQRERVRDGWTLTGDVVRRDGDGTFWFGRRGDGIIVSAGYNIAPREVEVVLEEHPAVARAEVTGVPDPTRGAVVAARVTLRPGAPPPTAELALALQQHTQRELSPYKCPRRIEFTPPASSGPERGPSRA
jgi:2-aminobenzoate-CoA ligase